GQQRHQKPQSSARTAEPPRTRAQTPSRRRPNPAAMRLLIFTTDIGSLLGSSAGGAQGHLAGSLGAIVALRKSSWASRAASAAGWKFLKGLRSSLWRNSPRIPRRSAEFLANSATAGCNTL